MSEKLCKKCGCVVFDPSSEFCDSCKPQEDAKEKKELSVNSSSSKQLSTLDDILMVVAIVMLIIGVIASLVGLDDLGGYYSDPTTFVCGVVVIVGGVSIFITRVFIKALITITKCAEYYNAQIEDKFYIQ